MELSFIYILVIAFVLDLIFGDPKWMPHLIVGYGNLIAKGEKLLNKGTFQFVKGMVLTIVLVSSTILLPFFVIKYL